VQLHAFEYYAFKEFRPVREASRLACVTKHTGRALHEKIRARIAADNELRRKHGR
jgi:hypothetical protein